MTRAITLVPLVLLGMTGCGGGGGSGDDAPANIAGTYIVDLLSVTSSNCDPRIGAALTEALGNIGACRYDVTQNGSAVTVVTCSGVIYRGDVDSAGVVDASAMAGATNAGCGVTTNIDLVVPALENPGTATFAARIDFSSNCASADCQGTAEARWTPQGQ